ncbi:MAG: sigma-54 dependent transcriptional regulator [Holophagales bacterium]|nr:sigma-54 dependent transcriptional regulator [Holophagales bacterium]
MERGGASERLEGERIPTSERILIVDDSERILDVLGGILEDEGFRVHGVATGAAAREALARRAYDLVFLDLFLPDMDGLELLEEIQAEHVDLPVVVISGQGNIDAAVRATRLGAYDFLEKPLALQRVTVTVHNALDRVRMSRRLEELSYRMEGEGEIVGNSPAMRRLRSELARAAASEGRILLVGENGTGKELAAHYAHRLSARARGPFVEVNCAAIPEELIESELFGHVKGSFTGASSDRAGRFEQADGGTLFLDEVADMSLKTQAKVLRALQEQRFERVGGGSSIQVDVRVIAATNKELDGEIRDGRFREDLYFRLAVIPIRVPALRERREDVPLLVQHFLALLARRQGRRPKRMSQEALERLRAYTWPGNVRELRNLVERLLIMVPDDEIHARVLPADLSADAVDPTLDLLEQSHLSLREARAAFEKLLIERRLEEAAGNVSRTAEGLELERSHLYRKLRAYGIEVRRARGAGSR